MTDVVIAPRVESLTSDIEAIASSGWFNIRPSKAYVSGGQWVQSVWPPDPITLDGTAKTVKLDPLTDVPYELYIYLPQGGGEKALEIREFRIVAGAGPVGWETLVQVGGPSGDPILPSTIDARLTALESSVGSVSGGASNVASITDMSPLARLFNKDATDTAMRSRINSANVSHTHGVADLTATGTKNSTTFLRGDNTFAVPPAADLTSFNAALASKADLNPTTGLVDAADIDPAIARQTDVTAAFASVTTPSWSNIVGVPTGRTYIDLILPGGTLAPRTSVGPIPPGWAVNWVSPTPPPIGGPYMLSTDTYERANV